MFDEKPDNFLNEEREEQLNANGEQRIDFTEPAANTEAQPAKKMSKFRKYLLIGAGVLFVALALTCWLRYFNPYVTDSRVTGFLTSVERRGIIFKTYEGEMISQQALTDTTRIYTRDFVFSVDNDSLAQALQDLQTTGKPVTLEYKRYHASVPWRGSSPIIVTGIYKK
ncbi:MAG: hypothetical protein HUK14_08415 [Muribaculaceae bacterium]|nr:hypothetical protein [Muribaculaceae bacterium]